MPRRIYINRFTELIAMLVLFHPFGLFASVKPQSYGISEHTLIEAHANQAAKEKRYAEAIYTFNVGDLSYRVTGAGVLSVQMLKSGRTLSDIRMDFPQDAYIAGIKYLSFGTDLIIVYDVLLLKRPMISGDKVFEDDVLQKRVVHLRARTLKTKWVAITSRSDPPGPLTIAAGSTFVSGVGEIGEIELATGYYLWRHEGVMQRSPLRYACFKAARVEGEYVFFQEDPACLRWREPETIQVRRRSGEIITMSYKPPK